MNKTNRDIAISGTEIKMNIHIDPLGSIHMSDYDFECKFFIFPKKYITVSKNDMIKVDNDNYLAIVDTTGLGIGKLHMTVLAKIPDADFGKIRREVVCVDTGIDVINC